MRIGLASGVALIALLWLAIAPANGTAASCAEGPDTVAAGTEVVGTPCDDYIIVTSAKVDLVEGGGGDDTIIVSGEVGEVEGGAGDDVIYGEFIPGKPLPTLGVDRDQAELYRVSGPATAPPAPAEDGEPVARGSACPPICYYGDGNQKMTGGSGVDWMFGQRGNDELHGGDGNDLLYGGPGDDNLWGDNNEDLLGGGFGYDVLDGGEHSDLIRGDSTKDNLGDTGSTGADTLSFATAVTPGFSGSLPYTGFPGEGGERGVIVRLDGLLPCSGYAACNADAPNGGGADVVVGWQFENVIGSPFSDVIVGNAWGNRIDGGGGADYIEGLQGNDTIFGGAAGDYIDGGADTDTVDGQGGSNSCSGVETKTNCPGTSVEVVQRDTSKVSVGMVTTSGTGWSQLYVVGSETHDSIFGSFWIDGATGQVHATFQMLEDSWSSFDTSAAAQTAGCNYIAKMVDCFMPASPDALVMAGMGHHDQINISGGGFWSMTTPVMLGGSGSDNVLGSETTEDILVDNEGDDWLEGGAYDDVLVNNGGLDKLVGGNGSDLLLSAALCGGDTFQGATPSATDGAKNSVSWAKLPGVGVYADLKGKVAGDEWSGTYPGCSSGSTSWLGNIDDLEGSEQGDVLRGYTGPNTIFGRDGNDSLYGGDGDDLVIAKQLPLGSGSDGSDKAEGNEGGNDRCLVDTTDYGYEKTCEKVE